MAPRLISNNIEVWLRHAIDIDNDIRRLALDDEDLRPVARLDGADFLSSDRSSQWCHRPARNRIDRGVLMLSASIKRRYCLHENIAHYARKRKGSGVG